MNTTLPNISGSPTEGDALSVSTGSWTAHPTSYAYAWKDCDGSGGACVAIAGANSSSYRLEASDVGHTIRADVTASNSRGSTMAETTATAVVQALSSFPGADATPPSAPTGLAAGAVAQTSLTLSWNASTDNVGVTGYRIYLNGSEVGTPSGSPYVFSGLSCGTSYTLGVAAVDAAGNVSSTATVSVATASCLDSIPPSTPTGLATSEVGPTSVTLSWSPSTDNIGVTGYRLYRNSAQVGTSFSTSYFYGGLACGTSYTLGVAALDGAGNVSGMATVAASAAACSGGGPAPAANVFVSTSGNNSTCVRGDQSKPCLTFARACSIAQAGDTVGVQPGTYAAQTIVAGDCPNTAPAITFTPVSGIVNVGGACSADCQSLNLGTPGQDCGGNGHDGPSSLTFRNMTITGTFLVCGGHPNFSNGTSITFDHIDTGAFEASGVANFVVKNSVMHDCYNGADFSAAGHPCLAAQSRFWSQCSCGAPGTNRATVTATLTNDIFRDYHTSEAAHGECLFPLDIDTLTIQNSWFYNCMQAGLQFEYLETPHSVLVQNNWFGRAATIDTGMRCGAIRFSANSGTITNTLIRYNSFSHGQGVLASSGTVTSGVRVIGNIIGYDPVNDSCAESTPPNLGAAVKDGNVWEGSNAGTHSNQVASVSSLYVNGSDLGSADYHLAGSAGSTVADNLVPCASGDAQLNLDKDGNPRPRDTTCDAGSEER